MLNYVKIYYMSAILGGKNMKKWEERYDKLKNGEFDARIDELKEKHDNKSITKEEYKEYQKLLKSKENLGKIDNVLEYKEQLKEELKNLELESKLRGNAVEASEETQRLEEELGKITEEIIETENKLKDPELKEHEREALSAKRDELYARRDDNNAKYAQNQKVLEKSLNRKDELKNLSEEEIKDKETLLKSRISKCNMVAKNLLNGASWDTIDLKLDSWNKLTNKGEKLSKKENSVNEINRTENNEMEDIFSSQEKEEEFKKLKAKEEKAAKFAEKHPRLAKIGNWFRKVLKKEKSLPELAAADDVVKTTENKEEKEIDSDKDFKEYIKVVAEKGIDGVKAEQKANRQQELKEKLEQMRAANRAAEAEKFGQEYADKSDFRTNNDDEGR